MKSKKEHENYQKRLEEIHSQFQTDFIVLEKIIEGVTHQKVTSKKRILGGEINEVYDVSLENGEKVIVRVSRRVKKQEFQREKWAITEAKQAGALVPELLLVKDVEVEGEKLSISIHRRIEGTSFSKILKDKSLNRDRLEKLLQEVGATLAKTHSVKTDGFGELNAKGEGEFKSLEAFFLEKVGQKDEYIKLAKKVDLEEIHIEKAFSILQSNIDLYRQTGSACLCHGDFSANNILVEDDRLMGVIDWGLASGGHPAYDFAYWDYTFYHWGGDSMLSSIKKGYPNKAIFDEQFDTLVKLYQVRMSLVRIYWYDLTNYKKAVEENKQKLVELLEDKHIKNALGDYKHVKIVAHEGSKAINKKVGAAEKEFYQLFSGLDFVLYPIKIEGEQAYFEYLDGGTIENKPKKTWEKAVIDIATYNSLTVPTTSKIPIATKGQYIARLTEIIQLAANNEIKLAKEGIEFVRSKFDELNLNSIAHDDLIAPNVLITGEKIKIIDWEHVKIDFKESDIGRFLADYYWDNPKAKKTYYPFEWHNDLVKTYLNQMKKLDSNYDIRDGVQRIKFSELWNYLGPIYRMMVDKEDLNSPWFKVNLEGFQYLSSTDPNAWIEK